MADLVFVDTNVLVYGRDASEPDKQPRAWQWRTALWRARAGRLSVQVLHEFYATVTRKLSPGMPVEQARAEVRDLFSWNPVPLTSSLTDLAWEIEERFKLSFWDALIVAAAHASECRYLLTEDLKEGMDLDGLVVVNPFRTAPEG